MTPVQRQVTVWLAAAGAIALTVWLGCWQLGRAEQKRAAHAELLMRQQQAPWSGADWPCGPAQAGATLPAYRPVLLRGHWLADRTVLLDNRPMDGLSGFIVVTPLRLSDASAGCAHGLVLVQRGWVPRDVRDRLKLPDLSTPSGEVQVRGRVVTGLSQTYQLGQEAAAVNGPGPLVRQNADVAFWSSWLGQSPLVGAVLQLHPEGQALQADKLLRHWPEPGQGQDKHLAYAAQWFAMAAVLVGLTLWFQILRPRRQSSHVPS